MINIFLTAIRELRRRQNYKSSLRGGLATSFPGSERQREPSWVWSRGSRTKLIVSRLRNDRKDPQEQDRFANATTITETRGNFCLNRTATR